MGSVVVPEIIARPPLCGRFAFQTGLKWLQVAWPKGKPHPHSGNRKGVPNKTTVDVREAIATFAQANVEHMGAWLNAIDDPAKRLDLYLRALEYHVPKLARVDTTHSGEVTVNAFVTLPSKTTVGTNGKTG